MNLNELDRLNLYLSQKSGPLDKFLNILRFNVSKMSFFQKIGL